MSTHDEKDLLSRELRQRSAAIGGHPIGMDDVRGRARSIRRRRNTVRGVVAAVVLAVAAPVGLFATDLLDSSRTQAPPAASDQVTPTPDSPAPTPRADGSFPLTVHGLERGEPARVPYVIAMSDQLVTPVVTLDLPESYSMITPYNGGWLAIGSSQYPEEIVMLDDNLEVVRTEPAGGYELAVSADRSRVAYVVRESNDTVRLVNAPTDGTEPVTWMLDAPQRQFINPVGFLDNDTVVYLSDTSDVAGIARADGTLTPIEGLLRVDDASETTGLISGLVSYDVDRGCSGVMAPGSGEMLWESCEHSHLRFSPDGRLAIADASYFDGPGSPTLSILDASTGTVVTHFSPARRDTVVGVAQAVWEDDNTVLAVLDERGDQAMLRLEADGSIEAVTDVVTTRDMSLSLWFADATRR